MAVLPISHFDWQVLRAAKRSKKPSLGRLLRITPSRRTQDGQFLTEMVERGLLNRVTGTGAAPFEATYTLTELGEHAAEYGECETTTKQKAEVLPVEKTQKSKKPTRAGR